MTPEKALRAATALLVLIAVAGVVLAATPFVLEYQPAGDDWMQPTKHHVITGALLSGCVFAVLFTMLSARLRATPLCRNRRR